MTASFFPQIPSLTPVALPFYSVTSSVIVHHIIAIVTAIRRARC
jgi:hypothetical protein